MVTGAEERGDEELLLNGNRVSAWGDEIFGNSGDGCITLRM